jgi:hypothetical protein
MRIAEGSDLKVGVLRFVGVKLKEVLCHTIFDVSDTLAHRLPCGFSGFGAEHHSAYVWYYSYYSFE